VISYSLSTFAYELYAYYCMVYGVDCVTDTSYFAEGTSKAGFKTQELLDSHFKKHAAEFGNITKEQYLKGAQDLVSSKPGGNILTKVRPNGDTIFYNKISNEFAVKTSDGIIRTYFKPTDGINYFNRQ
jgi:pyocin large subunit-like protein